MISQKIAINKVPGFSKLLLDYLESKPELASFYNQKPNIEGLQKTIENRNFSNENREVLAKEITSQYKKLGIKADFSILKETTTFTVTTGHQLNLLTGPLYLIYKIVSTINLAKTLKTAMPSYNFVPVYWLASEDHDFEEINNFNLFGKKQTWETTQKGAVGRFKNEGIAEILEQINGDLSVFKNAYNQKTLSAAVIEYMHQLFGHEGLMCIDADNAALKTLFTPIIKNELTQGSIFELVNTASQSLANIGYNTQVKPREINLFYLEDNFRERIVKNEIGDYEILNTNLKFSEAEILAQVDQNPERFSPNVILRPVYQEVILPNIAYVGGPAEVVYWLQLKQVFDQFKIDFPVLLPRNFALYVNSGLASKIEKLGFNIADFWKTENELKQTYLAKNAENEFQLNSELSIITKVFGEIATKAGLVDKSLEAVVLAENQKISHVIDQLEKRIRKAEEKKHETAFNQIATLKNKLFPEGEPQERVDNFLNFYINNPIFITQILSVFEPLNFEYNILKDI